MSDYRIPGANPITRAKAHPSSLKRAIAQSASSASAVTRTGVRILGGARRATTAA